MIIPSRSIFKEESDFPIDTTSWTDLITFDEGFQLPTDWTGISSLGSTGYLQ